MEIFVYNKHYIIYTAYRYVLLDILELNFRTT